jgi:hypothetical protein
LFFSFVLLSQCVPLLPRTIPSEKGTLPFFPFVCVWVSRLRVGVCACVCLLLRLSFALFFLVCFFNALKTAQTSPVSFRLVIGGLALSYLFECGCHVCVRACVRVCACVSCLYLRVVALFPSFLFLFILHPKFSAHFIQNSLHPCLCLFCTTVKCTHTVEKEDASRVARSVCLFSRFYFPQWWDAVSEGGLFFSPLLLYYALAYSCLSIPILRSFVPSCSFAQASRILVLRSTYFSTHAFIAQNSKPIKPVNFAKYAPFLKPINMFLIQSARTLSRTPRMCVCSFVGVFSTHPCFVCSPVACLFFY